MKKSALQSIVTVLTMISITSAHAQPPAETTPWQPDPALVEQLHSRPNNEANYDETAVPEYALPPVLGENPQQASAENWPQRRDQIRELFRQHVYGYRPGLETMKDVSIEYQVAEDPAPDPSRGLADGQKVDCVISKGGRQFRFPFYLYTPKSNQAGERSPLIVLINNRQLPNPAELVEQPEEFWPLRKLIEAGYATAVFHTSDVDPDRADGYQQGIRGFLADNEPRKPNDWGSLSAWGWGASRVVDYALASERIDPESIAVLGHSRGGKTALWAAAEDERFTVAYANESGCGGAALSLRRYGETVARITKVFPHWFAENYSLYGNNEDKLPVDQHQLIGLIAPRATYVASAAEDLWADPRGEYLSLVAAAPVYQLLGQQAITTPTMPPLGSQRIEGQTGYHIRPGEHNLTLKDWEYFLDFLSSVDF
jgi:hypothetical protein